MNLATTRSTIVTEAQIEASVVVDHQVTAEVAVREILREIRPDEVEDAGGGVPGVEIMGSHLVIVVAAVQLVVLVAAEAIRVTNP